MRTACFKSSAKKYCLWFNPETFEPIQGSLSQVPAERVPYGGYVPCIIGSKKQIERLIERLKKKTCLAEKYIKILE